MSRPGRATHERSGAEPRELEPKRSAEPVAASPATSENGSIRLITHQVRDVSPGVTGVDLTLGLAGHRFAGGASGKADSSGRKLVPALATLSALGSYIRFASNGGGPTLALESVSEVSLGASRVAVVVVTMSGHSAPLIASWPLTDASGPAVVRATLEAAARRVTRLSTVADHPPEGGTEPAEPTEQAEPSEPAAATELAAATEPAAAGGPAATTEPAAANSHSGDGGEVEIGNLGNGDDPPPGASWPQGPVGPDHRGPEPPFPGGTGSHSPPYCVEHERWYTRWHRRWHTR